MKTPSVAVIGGGVAGLSTAMHAAELGCEVTLVERDRLAAGSSSRSAGVFNISSTELLQVEVRVRTRELLDRFERENGLSLQRIGYMRLAKTEPQAKVFEEVIALQRELGAEPAELAAPARLKQLIPHLRTDDLVGAIHSSDDGCMNGAELCSVLAARAEARGATVLQGAEVEGHERVHGRHRLRTGNGAVDADVVVNAAGPWAMAVGELLGHPLPLVNQVNEVVLVQLPPAIDYAVPMVQEYVPGGERAVYFRQDRPGAMIAGMHTYAALEEGASAEPDGYEEGVAWDTPESVARHVGERLRVEGLSFEPGWAGLYPIGADGDFVVGPYEADPTVLACGGFGGQGLTSGVSVGAQAAEWIVHDEPRGLPGAIAWLPDRPSLR
ncbi:MAG TPA: FAD-dependent oxidoreductase [Actinomycetota bacterium]|nr:FAD-dependent oxidoreductase [Actinomycetota bacterium]